MLSLDCSKYTTSPPPIDAWKAVGVEHVIIQAHPAFYGQERSLDLMRAVQAAGLPWDAYLYQYLGYPDWMPDALETLTLAVAEGLVPRKVWLDVEDVDSGRNWTSTQRIAAVERDLVLCDQWLLDRGLLPNTAIYSAAWYWHGYMANTLQFADRQLWAAQYDGVADASVFTPFGGWSSCRIKQYEGSQPDGTDLDVLSAEEEAELLGGPDVPDENPCAGLIVTIADIADRLGDQLLAECKRSSVRKTEVRRIVAEMQAERTQAIGVRP